MAKEKSGYGSEKRTDPVVIPQQNVARAPVKQSRWVASLLEHKRSVGELSNPLNDGGILLSGDRPTSWFTYIDLSSAAHNIVLSPKVLVLGQAGADPTAKSAVYDFEIADNSGGALLLWSSQTNITTNATLGLLAFGGDETGSDFLAAVFLQAQAQEVWTATVKGSYFTVATTPTGSTTRREVMRVDANGGMHIGTTFTTPPASGLRTEGDIIVESSRVIINTTEGSKSTTFQLQTSSSSPGGILCWLNTGNITTGALLGLLSFGGDETGSDFQATVQIAGIAQQNWTSSNKGSYFRVMTTPEGSTTAGEKMRIDGDGGMHIGTGFTTPPVGGLRTEGQIVIESGGIDITGTVTMGEPLLINTSTDQGIEQLQVAGSSGGRMVLWRDEASITTGEALGVVSFGGDEGSSFNLGSQISGIAAQTWTGSNKGSSLFFATVNLGSTSRTEQMRIYADGGVHIGTGFTTPPAGGLRTEGQIIVEAGGIDVTGSFAEPVLINTSTDQGIEQLQIAGSSGGRMVLWRDDSTITTDNNLGVISFGGDEGSAFDLGAQVAGIAAENWSGANQGASLWFATVAIGASSRTERMRIYANGGVHIGSGFTAPPAGGLRTEGQIIVEANGIDITGTSTISGLTTVGALNSGSITSGFGNIDNGSSTLDTGVLTATTAQVDDGTSSSPSIFFTDQAGTGLFRPASNTIGIGIATAERIRFGASWIHVGTTFTTPPAGGIRTEGQVIVEASGIDMTGDLILRSFSTTAVSEGVTDSGGSGFKLLRVPN